MKLTKFSTYMMAGTALVAAALPMTAQVARADDDTAVQLRAEARRMVQQDRVTATLAVEASGKDAAAVQAEINGKMQQAKTMYDQEGSVKVSTGGYNVYKDYPREPEPKKDGTPGWTPEEREKNAFWRGSQELVLDGMKQDSMLAMIGDLQKQGFAVRNLNFYMSRELQDKTKDSLMVEALGNIKARAENIKTALGMKKIHYARIDVDNAGPIQPMPMMAKAMRSEAFDASGAAPVGEAGETEVVLNVTAEVKLK